MPGLLLSTFWGLISINPPNPYNSPWRQEWLAPFYRWENQGLTEQVTCLAGITQLERSRTTHTCLLGSPTELKGGSFPFLPPSDGAAILVSVRTKRRCLRSLTYSSTGKSPSPNSGAPAVLSSQDLHFLGLVLPAFECFHKSYQTDKLKGFQIFKYSYSASLDGEPCFTLF